MTNTSGASSIHAIAFDFDGVLAESVEAKTRAYARLFNEEKDEAVSRFVAYHIKQGGISRYEKIKVFYRDILQRPLSDKRFQELVLQFSKLIINKIMAAP